MSSSNERIIRPILFTVVVTLGVISLVAAFLLYSMRRSDMEHSTALMLTEFQDTFRLALSEDARTLNGMLSFLKSNTELRDAWIEQDRDALLLHALPIFQRLKSENRVTHFYFIGLDKRCFLRVHEPDRFGDVIDRVTLEKATTGEANFGIELGPLGTFTLRSVIPWRVDGELIGYLELGEEIEHLVSRLSRNLTAELIFTIEKQFLNSEIWKSHSDDSASQSNWDRYPDLVIAGSTLEHSLIAETLLGRSGDPSGWGNFRVDLDGVFYHAGVVPIIDARNQKVGTVIALRDVTATAQSLSNLLRILAGIISIIGMVLVLVSYRYFGKIQSKLMQQMQDESDIEEYHARATAVAESSVDSIVSIDDHGLIENINPSGEIMFGYERHELIGQNVRILMSEPERGKHDGYLETYRAGGEKTFIDSIQDVEGVRRDGTTLPLRISVSEVNFGEKKIFIGIMHDLTRETELKQQLLQAQKLESIGTLAGGIAHDFNNIIQAIMAFNKVAKENMDGNGKILSQCLDGIEGGSMRAAELVKQILVFSRKTEVDIVPTKLHEVLEEALSFIRSTLSANICIETAIRGDCAYVEADSTQIYQVVTNLCTNAMHAIGESGGVLNVSLAPFVLENQIESLSGPLEPGDYVQLSITDNGSGIELASLSKVLDPFFTTKEVGKGTGLGLAMVHGIVKDMHGGLIIETELGKGTTVRVLFHAMSENEVQEQADVLPSSRLEVMETEKQETE